MKSSTIVITTSIAAIWLMDLVHALNSCSAEKMWTNYREMKRANCRNCDKYFHCRANYEAVHQCGGPYQIFTAETISNAREWTQRSSPDYVQDYWANEYGRQGGDCASRYLLAVNCAYSPTTKTCGS